MTSPLKLVVLVSGRGSNLSAVLDAIERGACCAQVVAVISDREAAPALELAGARQIATGVVRPKDFSDRPAWDRALAECIAQFAPELVVLAGFMRLVGAATLERFAGRIINVHPALLPAFPGADAPAQAIQKRVSLSGCTVHVVDAGVDTGPILAQAAVPVLSGDDAASLHQRIQTAEHRLLPLVIDAIAKGDYELGESPRFIARDSAVAAPAYIWPPLDD